MTPEKRRMLRELAIGVRDKVRRAEKLALQLLSHPDATVEEIMEVRERLMRMYDMRKDVIEELNQRRLNLHIDWS